ncbi:MAG: hypothetical protein IPJ19_13715 [Planctomycetes bacterium]|nr:hypothetical protein [Planctomycetota bacterium]
MWYGHVAGREDSEVALSFSEAGANGWLRIGEHLDHIATRGDGSVREFSEERRLELGGAARPTCASPLQQANLIATRSSAGAHVETGGAQALYTCKIAIETDYQLLQVFSGNLSAEVAYITSLLTWVSYRYEGQIGTRLSFPYVQFYTGSNDPWTSQDSGGNCLDLLTEFRAAWTGNLPAGADLAHFLSGANLGCGAAYIGGLCDPTRNFGVTGNMDGNNQFPIQVGPSNFNFFGCAISSGTTSTRSTRTLTARRSTSALRPATSARARRSSCADPGHADELLLRVPGRVLEHHHLLPSPQRRRHACLGRLGMSAVPVI